MQYSGVDAGDFAGVSVTGGIGRCFLHGRQPTDLVETHAHERLSYLGSKTRILWLMLTLRCYVVSHNLTYY